jgi:hypothetical protein
MTFRSRLVFLFVVPFDIIVLLMGCSDSRDTTKDFEQYTYTVAFNDIVYGFTDEIVPSNLVGNLLGEATTVVSPNITKNGQIGCNVPGCRAPPGMKFYTINGYDQKNVIAVEGRNNMEYYKCVYLKEL